MTLYVIAADALDYGILEDFDMNLLSHSKEISTFTHTLDQPYTLEVWPTVATGVGPESHGVSSRKSESTKWDSPLLEFASKFTSHLPYEIRTYLGDVVEDLTGTEHSIRETDHHTVFDDVDSVVHNWPGVTNSSELERVWDIAKPQDGRTVVSYNRDLRWIGAEQFGWLLETTDWDVDVAATHIHTLDFAGHAFYDNRDELRSSYEWFAGWLDRIVDNLDEEDELLVLSDHGIETTWIDGDDVGGGHSMRAVALSTIDLDGLESVYDAREWMESHIAHQDTENAENVNLPTEQLEDLGYI